MIGMCVNFTGGFSPRVIAYRKRRPIWSQIYGTFNDQRESSSKMAPEKQQPEPKMASM
jgi:hypothetical protein